MGNAEQNATDGLTRSGQITPFYILPQMWVQPILRKPGGGRK